MLALTPRTAGSRSVRRSARRGARCVAVLWLLAGCPSPQVVPSETAPPSQGAGGVYALLVNGGGRPGINYYSHIEHLERLLDLLGQSGVPPGQVTVLSADGTDPAPDLTIRPAPPHPQLWLLPSPGIGALFKHTLSMVDSRLEHADLRPATRAELEAWFKAARAEIGPGDTLLVYVTDHGDRDADDPTSTRIMLWNEELRVHELREQLDRLDPAVRVLMVMSQCYSGGFVDLVLPASGSGDPTGRTCGYFSTTPDRKAAGCYPDTYFASGVGYSHRLFDALEHDRLLSSAHQRVFLTDRTPDAPHASSDVYLARLLTSDAEGKAAFDAAVDAQLAHALQSPTAWAAELALLDAVADSFGIDRVRSMADVRERETSLAEAAKRVGVYWDRWKRALNSVRQQNWRAFLAKNEGWRETAGVQAVKDLPAAQRTELANRLLPALMEFTQGVPGRLERLELLRSRVADTKDLRWRVLSREGALLRMRILLVRIAGMDYLESTASERERDAFTRLSWCEELPLGSETVASADGTTSRPEPFVPLQDDHATLDEVAPAWLGIAYKPVPREQRTSDALPAGAVFVTRVVDDSPASNAGLRVDDILIGPPPDTFRAPHDVREWIMRSGVGRPTDLRVMRDGAPMAVTLKLVPYPVDPIEPVKR